MKEQFREKKFSRRLKIKLSNNNIWSADIYDLLEDITCIIEKYQDKGIKMTLRQLYYQLVSADIIPNDDRVYKKISTLLTDARYNGIVDWSAIEDRVRIPKIPNEWNNIPDIVESAIYSFRLPRWKNQLYHIELITEKDALSSIISPIALKWHIPFSVNRGYTSATAMYSTFERIYAKCENWKKIILLYLGDHDPSGLDMIRDIEERLQEFMRGRGFGNSNYDYVIPIALTQEQIRKYSPPPNPAKITDPRAKWYISEYGEKSWEVDALPPDVMISIIEDSIEKFVDMEEWKAVLQEEEKQKEKLKKILNETNWE